MNLTIKFCMSAMLFFYYTVAFSQVTKDNCVGVATDLDCPSTLRTVCGCDGVTYDNECLAREKGVLSITAGACGTKGKNIGKDCIGEISREVCFDPPRPVCGCDGTTYKNECEARVAGVRFFSAGACGGSKNGGADSTNIGGDDKCIGKKVDKRCTSTPEPVCGCDGKDYANPCTAEAAGVKTFVRGKCGNKGGDKGSGNPDFGTDPGKGGGKDGGDDCQGKKINKICTSIFEPVCGCDGQTYSNACAAEVAGIKSFVKGECKKGGGNDGGDDCQGKKINKICTSLFEPVCGCDGQTYSNACAAEVAGIKRFVKGECKKGGGNGTGKPDKEPNDPGKGGNATGCAAIYNYITPGSDNNNEIPACKVSIDMFPCENGEKSIAEPLKNIKRVILAKEGIVDNRNSCFSQSFLCLPSQVSADSIGGGDLKSLDDAVVKVRETGYFEVRTKKDRFLLGGDFGKPNEKGELWSTCNYKNKNYCVRLIWQKGVLDRRNKFTKL